MVKPHLLRRWFPNQYRALDDHADDGVQQPAGNEEGSAGRRRLPNYKMYPTHYTRSNNNTGGTTSPTTTTTSTGIHDLFKQVLVILRMTSTWRVLVFGFASFTIAMNWTASEMVLPPFLERRFGEETPIYIIQSINLFGCLILPPIVGAFTSGREDFSIVMPGLWIMATSPLFVALFPTAAGACVWQVFMTAGEVLWSPRQISWTASLAPTGSEGLFFAISSARSITGPLTDFLMGAINEKYNPNCPECRDQYGHFCKSLSTEVDGNDNLQCVSAQESCDLFLENDGQSCPRTCPECPSWEPTDPSACWYLLLLACIATPISVWFFLPFLRGRHDRNDRCFGIFSLGKSRFLGICGALEDEDNHRHSRMDGRQLYGHVDGEKMGNDARNEGIQALGENVELT
mmetsp:Transcript_22110/g.53569  ORF Transcript_22110/g.53569 Transcript_22110/m.53569 type:complete len:402 (-) Transcript_22110:17-1222(-)